MKKIFFALLILPVICFSQPNLNYVHSYPLGGPVNNVPLTVKNFQATVFPAPYPGTIAYFVGIDSVSGRNSNITIADFNNVDLRGPAVRLVRSRGWYNNPQPTLSGDIIGVLNAMGYKATKFNTTALASIAFRAAENFKDDSAGTYISFLTTAIGDTINVEKFRINSDGSLRASAYTAGFMRTDASGNIASSALNSSDITAAGGALSSTLANYPTTATVTSMLAAYVLKTDSGRATSNWVTGYSLNKVRDSLSGLISGFMSSTLASGNIFVGNGSNVATARTPSGDLTMNNTGVFILANTGVGAATYNFSTGSITVDTKGRITAAVTQSRTPAFPTRSLNTAFQPSTTTDVIVSYAVDIACTLTLTGGQTGTVVLEYADDSGISTNVKTVQSTANANTGTLTIGLSLTQTATASLSGVIPAGKWVRLRTVNTTGTPTFTYRSAAETPN